MKTVFFSLIQATLLLLALSACAPTTQGPEQITTSPASKIEQLLNNAEQTSRPGREQLQLQASQLLIEEGQYKLAQKVLNSIHLEPLSPELKTQQQQLLSQLLIKLGHYQEALNLLDQVQQQQYVNLLPQAQQLALSELRATVLALLGSHLASAQQRIYIAPLLDSTHRLGNQQAIWRSLMMLSDEELQHFLPNAFGDDYIGWLQLALIAKQSHADLDEQLQQLQQWQQRWPSHPASQQLPDELTLLQQLAESRPQHVALLLPLSGKLAPYGKAIRDGFIASRYHAQQRGAKTPELSVFDTESQDNFIGLYQQAVEQGAELIIGPLDKNRLRLLFDQVSLPVATLALNQVDDYGQAPQQLIQFSLAPQDEARQIAELAYLDQHRNALVIVPDGTWAEKIKQAFSEHWQALGGEIVASGSYRSQQDYSPAIKTALMLDDSEQRAKKLNQILGTKPEFLPRRRADVDMIFLLAKPEQARSIVPLLAYHYASDLPVYATSRAYSGTASARQDRDIEGIRFTDMPWVLDAHTPLQQQINQELSSARTHTRMLALGIDSYQLYPRLTQLRQLPNSQVFGQTGTLSLNSKGQIERKLMFATIKHGIARKIPIASNQQLSNKDGDSNVFYQTP